jgi:hypothetical protein
MSSEDSAPPTAPTDATHPEGYTLEEFFLQAPPGGLRAIKTESFEWETERATLDQPVIYTTPLPELKLHRSSEKCGGLFWFKPSYHAYADDLITLSIGEGQNRFIEYICKSCGKTGLRK